MLPVVKSIMFVLWPICYPISKALDYFLGAHVDEGLLKKKDLKALVNIHTEEVN